MKDVTRQQRWQDWINLLIGIWLFISPWAVGFEGSQMAASWNAWILGVAVVVFSAIAVSMPQAWEEIINLLLGVWMLISSWVIDVTSRAAQTNAVVVGLLVILFAILAVAMSHDGHRKAPMTS
ncbi:MAG: SPW repeat protein [Proteobacteria bacterium]|jgi:uncharacterized RDD family membrane protein YckC|nr:SPW repeat protein [Pseudomonadota bacterium]